MPSSTPPPDAAPPPPTPPAPLPPVEQLNYGIREGGQRNGAEVGRLGGRRRGEQAAGDRRGRAAAPPRPSPRRRAHARPRGTAASQALVARAPVFYGWVVGGLAALAALLVSPVQVYCVGVVLDAMQFDLALSRMRISAIYAASLLSAAPSSLQGEGGRGRLAAGARRALRRPLLRRLRAAHDGAGPHRPPRRVDADAGRRPRRALPRHRVGARPVAAPPPPMVGAAVQSIGALLGMLVLLAILSAVACSPDGARGARRRSGAARTPRSAPPSSSPPSSSRSSCSRAVPSTTRCPSTAASAVHATGCSRARPSPPPPPARRRARRRRRRRRRHRDARRRDRARARRRPPPPTPPPTACRRRRRRRARAIDLDGAPAAADAGGEPSGGGDGGRRGGAARARRRRRGASCGGCTTLTHTSFWLAQISISTVHAVVSAFLFHRKDLMEDVRIDPNQSLTLEVMVALACAVCAPPAC